MRQRRNIGRAAIAILAVVAAVVAVIVAASRGDKDTGTNTGGGVVTPAVTPTPTPTPVEVPSDKTIAINGQQYTCDQTLGSEGGVCSRGYQQAFNEWGDNIPTYVDSGKLGALGNNLKTDANPNALMRYEDVAASGLAACLYAWNGQDQQAFIDYLHRFYPDEDSVAFLPLWHGAGAYLCLDAFANDGGHKSRDLVLP